MKIMNTTIDGLKKIKHTIFRDKRGYFIESYNEIKYKNLLGKFHFVQHNRSKSLKGVLRGLHFQEPPFDQSKLVSCFDGEILDIAVDLRKNSKTFGEYESNILSDRNSYELFIPKGFAHGFVVLSESAIVSYKVDNFYNPEYEKGIIWNDPDLNIDWTINDSEIIISEKDKYLPQLSKIINPF